CPRPFLQLKRDPSRGPSLRWRSSSPPSQVLRPPRTPARHAATSPSAYTQRSAATTAAETGLSCSPPCLQRVPLPVPRRGPSLHTRTRPRWAWPSPGNARLGPRIVILTRRQASLHVAARAVASAPRLSLWAAFDAPLWPAASRPSAGACYRALRCLPGRDSHPPARWSTYVPPSHVLQDATPSGILVLDGRELCFPAIRRHAHPLHLRVHHPTRPPVVHSARP